MRVVKAVKFLPIQGRPGPDPRNRETGLKLFRNIVVRKVRVLVSIGLLPLR